MKLTAKKLKELIKEELSNNNAFNEGASPYDDQPGIPEDAGVEKDENGNLIYYRDAKTGVLWPKPQNPGDIKVAMKPVPEGM